MNSVSTFWYGVKVDRPPEVTLVYAHTYNDILDRIYVPDGHSSTTIIGIRDEGTADGTITI